jgi:aminoacylase
MRATGKKHLRDIHLTYVPDEEIGGHLGMELFVNSAEFQKLNVGAALDEGYLCINHSIQTNSQNCESF